jgi:hypothetical protein
MKVKDKGMDYYIMLLEGLERLFYNMGNKWEQWIEKDIQDFKKMEDVTHHLRAYGELGGINSVYISSEEYNLPKGSELWVNKLLKEMLKLTYYFAGEFHHGEQISHTALIDTLSGKRDTLICNKCLHCKYGSIQSESIESFLVEQIISKLMKLHLEKESLLTLINQVCEFKIPELEEYRNGLIQALHGKNIHIASQNKRMLTCPRCESNTMNAIEYQVNRVNMLYTDRYILTPAYVNI